MNKLLIADDEQGVRYAFERTFGEEFDIVPAENGQVALDIFHRVRPDVVLMDIRMPVLDGLSALKRIKEKSPNTPVILMTAYTDTATAMEAMKEGAFDYVTKPFDNEELHQVLTKAFSSVNLLQKVQCRHQVEPRPEDGEYIVGSSPAIINVCKTIGQVACSDVPVLITGETGVGKELAARALYQCSERNKAPFMVVNCASLPETLIESELFGYETGAFTGAVKQRIGRFEQCDGGTLFLDEIGEMPLAAQAKLLRVLQDGSFERLGGNRVLKTDVRILAATNRDLTKQVEDGAFRSDLFHRLHVVSLRIPPLRERTEDIEELVDYYIRRFGAQVAPPVSRISVAALKKLKSYAWPGNIRELENTLRRAIVMARTSMIMEDDLLFDDCSDLSAQTDASLETLIEKAIQTGDDAPYLQVVSEVERLLVGKALKLCQGNQAKAARLLGINRMTLRKKMTQFF